MQHFIFLFLRICALSKQRFCCIPGTPPWTLQSSQSLSLYIFVMARYLLSTFLVCFCVILPAEGFAHMPRVAGKTSFQNISNLASIPYARDATPFAKPTVVTVTLVGRVIASSLKESFLGCSRRLWRENVGFVKTVLSNCRGLHSRFVLSFLIGLLPANGMSVQLFRCIFVWSLLPSFLAIGKGTMYPIAASLLLCQTIPMKMAYLMLTLPWWLSNKLSLEHGAENVDSVLKLHGKDDDRNKKMIFDHLRCRHDRSQWTKLDHSSSDWKISDLTEHLCGYGGSLVTQYFVFGSEHLDRYRSWHVKVAAAAHVLMTLLTKRKMRKPSDSTTSMIYPQARNMTFTFGFKKCWRLGVSLKKTMIQQWFASLMDHAQSQVFSTRTCVISCSSMRLIFAT